MDSGDNCDGKQKKKPLPKIPPGKDLDLLLLGKSELRNISAGNSFLGRRAFTTLGGGRSHQVAYSEVDGRVIKMVDILGFGNEDFTSTKKATDYLAGAFGPGNGLGQFRQGFDAILIVTSFTKPISRDEQKAIKALKVILGKDVLKKHGVCVMTHGDSFDGDREIVKMKSSDLDFQLWCRNQKGFAKELFEECCFRCVLIDNVSQHPAVLKSQMVDLVTQIDIKIEDRYTGFTFETFLASRKEDTSVGKHSVTMENVERGFSLMQDAFQKVMKSSRKDRLQVWKSVNASEKALVISQEIDQSECEQLFSLNPDLEQISQTISDYEFQSCDSEDKNELENLNKMFELVEKMRIRITEYMQEENKNYYDWVTVALGVSIEKKDETASMNPFNVVRRVQPFKRVRSTARWVGNGASGVMDAVVPIVSEGAGLVVEAVVEVIGGVLEAVFEE